MTFKQRLVKGTGATAIAGMLLAGCGSGTSSSSAQAPALKGTPLRIGVMANLTGPPQDNGERNGPPVLVAWAKNVNEHGGLAGHPVEIVVKDTKGDAPTAAAAFAQDRSIIALAIFDSGAEFAFTGPVTKSGIPVIGGMRYLPTFEPNWYSPTTSYPANLNAAWELAHRLGSKRVAQVVCIEIPSCGASEPLARKAAATLGMTFVGSIKVSQSAPDYTAQCLVIKQDHVDYVDLEIDTTAAFRMISACKTQGYQGHWGFAGGLVVPQIFEQQDPGVPIDFTLFSFPWFSGAAPAKAYRAMMARQGVPKQVWASPQATAAYTTAELFASVVRNNKAKLSSIPTRADISRLYGTVKNETLGGLLPQPLTFSETAPQQPVSCYWIGRYYNGQFTSDPLDHPTCDPHILKD
jgi:branched-chain amino acid transport system substrate-binding protein